MPKQLKELRLFNIGTKSSASDTDMPLESAIYSKNIDALSEEGKLKGVKEHIKILTSNSTVTIKVIPPPPPAGYTAWPTNWTDDLADESTADLFKDVSGNYYLGYDLKLNLNHKGLGNVEKVINLPVPVYTPTGGQTDAEILRGKNDKVLATIKTTLEAQNIPGMTVNIIRHVNGLDIVSGPFYYPSDGVTDFIVNEDTGVGQEEFIVNGHVSPYDGLTYDSGEAVPELAMAPYRSFEINFDRTYTDDNNVDWNVDNMSVSITVPKSDTDTEIYDINLSYPNTENEIIQPGAAASSYYPIYDVTEYLDVNATEMEFSVSEDKHNLVFYSITENDISHPAYDPETDTGADTTYRMKLIEDFYGDKFYIDSYDADDTANYFDLPGEPLDVSLAKKNADVYVGTGNTEGDKSKFFGKLAHKQFDHALDDYRLEDSEVYPLDDGQTVFNLMQISYNRHGTGTGQILTTDKVYGINDGMMNIFGINNIGNGDDTSPDSDTNANLGVQFKPENPLTFTPTSLSPSKFAYESCYDITDDTWEIDSTDIFQSSNWSHDANTSYWWCADKYRDAVQMVRTSFDGTAITNKNHTVPINLNYDKPPPPGMMITDVIETYDSSLDADEQYKLWVLYSKKDWTPFTWDQEFVFTCKVSDINWANGTVAATTCTPPALKMYKAKAWSGGSGSSRSIYVDNITHKIDFDHFPYVCHEGTWSCRQNKFYYRKCDELGETTGQSWNSLNARHWDREDSYGSWDLGVNAGFVESEPYEITPHRYGLVDLGHDHRIGMIGKLKGKFVSDAGKLSTQRVSPNSNWPDRKYNIYPSRNAATLDIDDTMMFFLDADHKGAKHRKVVTGMDNVIGGTQSDDDEFAYKYCSYKFDATDKYNMMAIGFNNSTSETGYGGYTDINKIPTAMSDIIGFNKVLSSTGLPVFWVSVRGNDGNATTMQRYTYDYPTRSGIEPINGTTKKFSINSQGSLGYTPMIFEKLGCSVFAFSGPSVSTGKFFFSPRQGTYINADGNWDASAGWVPPVETNLSTGETGDLYLDEYIKHHEHSELEFGLLLAPGDLTGVDGDGEVIEGNFNVGNTYFYKMSVLYDGFQESPMTTFYFTFVPTVNNGGNCNSVVMTVKLEEPAPRATHIVIYRKNAVEDFYRMVTEIDLAEGWGTVGDAKFAVKIDNGILGATYEAITGMPESLRHTNINYTISCNAGGYLFIGNCFHKDIKNGQNFIFRSQPDNYSIFNWTRDFLILPNSPTALAYWAGRLYAFDKANMYRIDPNSMVIEDEHAGVGCFGEQSYIVTDFGLYFCDINNMYVHNGANVMPIGTDVLKNSKYDETGSIRSNWHNIDHAFDPYVAYDAFNQTVMFMWEDKSGAKGSWNFNIPRKRWDLVDIPNPKAFLQGKLGERLLSDGSYLYELNKSETKLNWTHHTPSIDFGYSTVDKKIKKLKIIFNNTADVSTAEFTMNVYSDDVLLYTVNHPNDTAADKKFKDEEHEREYKIPKNKTKKLRIELVDSNIEIDSIAITYNIKKVD